MDAIMAGQNRNRILCAFIYPDDFEALRRYSLWTLTLPKVLPPATLLPIVIWDAQLLAAKADDSQMAFEARGNLGIGRRAQERVLPGSPGPLLAWQAMAQTESETAGLDAGWMATEPFADLYVRCSSQQGIFFRSKAPPTGLGHPDMKPGTPVFHGTECAP